MSVVTPSPEGCGLPDFVPLLIRCFGVAFAHSLLSLATINSLGYLHACLSQVVDAHSNQTLTLISKIPLVYAYDTLFPNRVAAIAFGDKSCVCTLYQQSRCARSTQKKLQATIGFSAYLSVGIVNRHSMTTLILTIRRENKLNEFVTSCVCTLWQLACGVKPWMLKHDSGDMNLAAGCCDMVPKTWTLKVML